MQVERDGVALGAVRGGSDSPACNVAGEPCCVPNTCGGACNGVCGNTSRSAAHELTVFVDGALVELFFQGAFARNVSLLSVLICRSLRWSVVTGEVLTQSFGDATSQAVSLKAVGGAALVHVDAWKMGSADG